MTKPEQAGARLRLQRGDMGRAQPCRLGTVDRPVLAASEHPVDHAAVKWGKQGCRNAAPRKVNMSIQPKNRSWLRLNSHDLREIDAPEAVRYPRGRA